MIGPMPGTVMTLRQLLSLFAKVSISSVPQSSLPSDLDDLDAGLLGARDHVGGAATAGKGQYDIWLLVEHHLIALRPPAVPHFSQSAGTLTRVTSWAGVWR